MDQIQQSLERMVSTIYRKFRRQQNQGKQEAQYEETHTLNPPTPTPLTRVTLNLRPLIPVTLNSKP